MLFGDDLGLMEKEVSFGHFLSFQGSSTYESKNFCQNRSVQAEKLQGTLFLNEESEKNGPRQSVDPSDSNMGGSKSFLSCA
jgi:hypothetical protein